MRVEAMTAAGQAAVISSSAVFSYFGTSGLAVLMAIIGAVVAILELEQRTIKSVVGVVVFGIVLGSLGAPLIVDHYTLQHPAALSAISFCMAYVAYDWLVPLKALAWDQVRQRLGGKKI